MAVSSTIVLLVISQLAFAYIITLFVYRLYFHPLSHIPGPKIAAATDWYEFYFDVIGRGVFCWEIKRMHDKYGPIVRINPNEVHILDSSFYHKIYAPASMKRDKSADWVVFLGVPTGVFATCLHEHHNIRRKALNPSFSKKAIYGIEGLIQDKIDRLCRRFELFAQSEKHVRLDVAFFALANDIVTKYTFGEDYDCLGKDDFQQKFKDTLLGAVECGAFIRQFPWVVPLIRRIPLSVLRLISETFAAILSWENIVQRRVKTLIERKAAEDEIPSTSVFRNLLNNDSLPAEEKSSQRLLDEGKSLMGAGSETTSWTLTILMWYVTRNPEILRKLREELQEMPHKNPSGSLLKWLEGRPYLSAVVSEALRLNHGAIGRLPRIAREPLDYKGYVIPPRTPLSSTNYWVHMDEDIFPEPEKFSPDRWLQSQKTLQTYMVSFSKGSRQCVGQNLATAQLYLTVAALIPRFNLDFIQTTEKDVLPVRDSFIPRPDVQSQGVSVQISTAPRRAISSAINTCKMRYTPLALQSLKVGGLNPARDTNYPRGFIMQVPLSCRPWSERKNKLCPPKVTARGNRRIGQYPLTSKPASWVVEAFAKCAPSQEAYNLVQPFSDEFHMVLEHERAVSTGFHDLNLIELIYQITLEVGGKILIAATESGDAAEIQAECHSSRAARDGHLAPWGNLLTGLDCDPPIIAQFPFYLMMCQSFSFETESSQENYVYAALTGIDWAKGHNTYSERFRNFETHARAALPDLSGKISGEDRSFWRIPLAYLDAMNKVENARKFTAPRRAHIRTDLNPYLLMAVRGFDTIGTAYMCSDGAAYLDKSGMDSLIGSAVANDVMDLHNDIVTGETRNLLRLLYPDGHAIDKTISTMSTVFSGMLCELFRGHKRARFDNREDGRIAATSPPYSFSRARHRRIFEVIELYSTKYPKFWNWTWEIYHRARKQVTEAGLNELLVDALHRGVSQTALPDSDLNDFYKSYFQMIDQSDICLQGRKVLGVDGDLGELIRKIHSLWHTQLLEPNKKCGWGSEFDEKSDALLKEAGQLLGSMGCITSELHKFAIAYGRLSMALPYIAYHTIAAIISTYGVIVPG